MTMKQSFITAIDIGTTMTRVVVAEERDEDLPYIVAAAEVPSSGMRRGGVVDAHEAANGVIEGLRQVQMQIGAEIDRAIFSLSGTDMVARTSKGVVIVGRADGEISADDVDRVLMAAQAISIPANKEIIHVLPRHYNVDDQKGIKDPIGMSGVRLEIEALIIDAPVQNIRGLETVSEVSGCASEEVVVAPLATAESVLDRQQRELGVVLINIGAATTSIVVYEEGELVHTAVLPIGAGHVTNDIAIGLRTAVDTAETIKLNYGVAIANAVDRREECDLGAIDPREEGLVSRYHIAEIIQARMEEIFSLIQDELVKIGKANLLPAGAIITGGGAKLPYVVNLAKEILHLPVRIGEPLRMPGVFDRVDDPAYVTALGLVHWAINHERAESGAMGGFAKTHVRSIAKPFTGAKDTLSALFEKFFP